MAVQYYLIPSEDEILQPGSILQKNEKLIDLDTSIELNDENLNDDWIEIQEQEVKWLLQRSVSERVYYQRLNCFKKISDLGKDENCFYRNKNDYVLSKVVKKTINDNDINFTIHLENGQRKDVKSEDIDLYNDTNIYAKDIEELMKLLLDNKGDIQLNDQKKRFALSLAYELRNKRYFKMLLDTNKKPLDIGKENIQSLLRKIVRNKDWHILDLVLRKCTISKENNTFLVHLCIEALRNGDNDLLEVVFQFAPNMDPLVNDETFLTNLFKENISGPTIKNVIEMNLFDVNLANKKNESPLMFACERLSKEVVEALLIHGADAQFGGFAATQKAVNAVADTNEKIADKAAIMGLLHRQYINNANHDPIAVTIDQVEDVPLGPLEEKILEMMKLLVVNEGDMITFNDENVSVLHLLYDLPNKRLFQIFVDKHIGRFDLMGTDNGKNLIMKMINMKDMISLKAVLDKCVYKDIYDVFLLNCALTIVKYGMKSHYKMIVEKSKNRDVVIASGETFLTSCLKENVKGTIISDIIDSIYFNIDKPNEMDETPLMLACERSLVDCVRRLLNKGADRSYRDYCAVKILTKNDEGKPKVVDQLQNEEKPFNAILDLICGKNAAIKEKLQYTNSGFIDTEKIATATKLNNTFQIGDPVIVSSNNTTDPRTEVSGEVKWIGLINNQICVGIESAEPNNDGFDGIIHENIKFECAPGHGILATTENVKLDSEKLECKFLPSMIIDPNTYLKFNEIKDKFLLKRIGLQISDFVIANIIVNGKVIKSKGILRWLGIVNDKVFVGIVELAEDYEDGTNGRFWKSQLVHCKDKRAVALKIENISKPLPFIMSNIPDNLKRFDNIDVNCNVICYYTDNDNINELHGKVVWTGFKQSINEHDESGYVYGIELNDDFELASDGEFEGQRLFICNQKRGIISSIGTIVPEVEMEPDNDFLESQDVELHQFCIPSVKYSKNGVGIAGHKYSSFLDSFLFALFSKSDLLDWLICLKRNEFENNKLLIKIREIMIRKIVSPIRWFSYVSYHKIRELREVIRQFNRQCDEISDPYSDLENFSPVLRELCRGEPLLNVTTSHGNQSRLMFILTSPILTEVVSSLQLLDIYMIERNAFFEKIPTCLMLKVPRNHDKFETKSLLPLKVIEISHLCLNHTLICSHDGCQHRAVYRCQSCVNGNVAVRSGLLCENHKCDHNIIEVHSPEEGSRSSVQLYLKSIICVSNNQSVAYVKQSEVDDSWFLFNNGVTEKPVSPSVTEVEDVTLFLNQDMSANINIDHGSIDVERITKNSYILVYFNSTMSCY